MTGGWRAQAAGAPASAVFDNATGIGTGKA